MANPTLAQLVEQARGLLSQFGLNRPLRGTFKGWTLDQSGAKIGVQLGDVAVGASLNNVLVELGYELIYVTSYDPTTSTAICPPWFRGQNGTALNDTYPVGSPITIDPMWPYWDTAYAITEGISTLWPDLFAVKTTQVTSSAVAEKYVLPQDVYDVLNVKLELFGAAKAQRQIGTWTVDLSPVDGLKYLHIASIGVAGRPIYITYGTPAVVPDPAAGSATWTSTGLPATAADLPVLYAVSKLLPAADAARTQSSSMEQSERIRLQPYTGAATATASAWRKQYVDRLEQERRKLLDHWPPRVHRSLNG